MFFSEPSLDLEINQVDVITTFLNGDIDMEMYVEQPEGYNRGENLVCKLNKGLYSLKQSPRLWNHHINTYLIRIGFHHCISDQCIYIKRDKNNELAIIGLWVNDIVIAASKCLMNETKNLLKKEFKITDQGSISYVLGILVKRDREKRCIYLNQQ